jgi:Xaa-Pro aminopeptidase
LFFYFTGVTVIRMEKTANFTAGELRARRRALCAAMNTYHPDWETALFADPVNQYYLTGTIQDALIVLRRTPEAEGHFFYGVRRSYSRACRESPLFQPGECAGEEIFPIASYRDLAGRTGSVLGRVYLEGDTMPFAVIERLKKYFVFSRPAECTGAHTAGAGFLDAVIRQVRSIKSPAEINLMRRAGDAHRILLEERVPAILCEGISEAEFFGELSAAMYQLGYQGITRFHQCRSEMCLGQIGFGVNALVPSFFDGPGGAKGNCPAAPFGADEDRRLQKGDAVFVDIGFGIGGYHTDKTQVYFFGARPPDEFVKAHQLCVDIQRRLAGQLVPGAIPSKLYQDMLNSLNVDERDCFMGVDNDHQVKFAGHGTGLDIDELPVLAKGFDEPLCANMTLALEPKKAVAGTGLAGVEDTYIVTEEGGLCITGGGRDIIVI